MWASTSECHFLMCCCYCLPAGPLAPWGPFLLQPKPYNQPHTHAQTHTHKLTPTHPTHPQEVVLIEHDINTSPFTPAVHECVPTLPWRVTPDHLAQPGRADLRHIAVCSVDPPGCKDIDDALHVRLVRVWRAGGPCPVSLALPSTPGLWVCALWGVRGVGAAGCSHPCLQGFCHKRPPPL